jgi:hypothetical protein
VTGAALILGIPAKLNAFSEGKPNGIPGWSRTPSERRDAGNSIVKESVRLRQGKPVRSEAEGLPLAGKGERRQALPRLSSTVTLEREWRSRH